MVESDSRGEVEEEGWEGEVALKVACGDAPSRTYRK